MRSQDNLERANASTRELANLESKLNVYFDHVKGNTGDAILFR